MGIIKKRSCSFGKELKGVKGTKLVKMGPNKAKFVRTVPQYHTGPKGIKWGQLGPKRAKTEIVGATWG